MKVVHVKIERTRERNTGKGRGEKGDNERVGLTKKTRREREGERKWKERGSGRRENDVKDPTGIE